MPHQKNAPTPQPMKRVTLQDIADVVGTKKMVVSNALNGKRSVAPATRERVLQVAREMNYIPNFAARALVAGRTGIIAILSGPINEPYYGEMVHLLEKHISANGFHLMLLRTQKEVKELVNLTGQIAVDGAIAVDRSELVEEFRSHPSIPCVSIGTFAPSFVDNVVVDLSASVEEALALMLSSGRGRIAYLVTAAFLARATEVRARAYRAAMKKANQQPEIINVATDDAAVVEANFRAYVKENGAPDALLCQNDETAMCAFRVLRDFGYRVPNDVLLVGCDGQQHTRYFDPPLSTIEQPMQEMCALAWQFLNRRMNQPDLPHQEATLEGKLVVRESLAFAPRLDAGEEGGQSAGRAAEFSANGRG